jgi:hypothetical protein
LERNVRCRLRLLLLSWPAAWIYQTLCLQLRARVSFEWQALPALLPVIYFFVKFDFILSTYIYAYVCVCIEHWTYYIQSRARWCWARSKLWAHLIETTNVWPSVFLFVCAGVCAGMQRERYRCHHVQDRSAWANYVHQRRTGHVQTLPRTLRYVQRSSISFVNFYSRIDYIHERKTFGGGGEFRSSWFDAFGYKYNLIALYLHRDSALFRRCWLSRSDVHRSGNYAYRSVATSISPSFSSSQ